ncbi:ATP-NAD kinase-like domain-containing protein [Radiomyces spectabilis]|uniref:ATP-NAD kinase-like domain-containing protein n=1 Tax=Radiomyces spectabilis TaxID=64574 RepID=UPI002220439D|nr:ATP-NAD kinase-like domain-containing protein [Radiomyces spectabilis]KAI8365965.1 ATP-NAD kinase-like domain-containing protein [Radiomyces spectabilis]
MDQRRAQDDRLLAVAATADSVKNAPRSASMDVDISNLAQKIAQCKVGWNATKDTIIIITKARDNKLVRYTRQLTEWLILTPRYGKKHPFTVYVDAHLQDSKLFNYRQCVKEHPIMEEKLKFWTPKLCFQNPRLFHLIITMGGDGTVLFTSRMFQNELPPIIPFHLGSLGFLTPFPFETYKQKLDELFNQTSFRSTTRMRLSCTVYRHRKNPACREKSAEEKEQELEKDVTEGEETVNQDTKTCTSKSPEKRWELRETAWVRKQLKKNEIEKTRDLPDMPVSCYNTTPYQTFHVLNELVVDRGPNPSMSMLELFGDERHLTTVQADGLCIATATGSTAYSLSANGSLTHPDIRCTLVTPLCPHTLNFRPMLLPESMTVRIAVPFTSRTTAYCSFDGRNRVELKQGDHIKITPSKYPLTTICTEDTTNDWFAALQECLQWNVRQRQGTYMIFESPERKQKQGSQHGQAEQAGGPNEQEEQQSKFACIRRSSSKRINSSNAIVGEEITEDEEEEDGRIELVPWKETEMNEMQTEAETQQ